MPHSLIAQDFGSATSDTKVGYIDNAIVRNQVRIRFDSAFDNKVPDRAEFFYAKCGCFRVIGADPNAPGPPEIETNLDYHLLQADLELVVGDRLSAFVETPVRFINPEQNDNTAGLSDLQAGFKYALWACPHRALTFQLRTYIPTGDADRGLGTDHVSVEPALLLYEQLSESWTLEAEFRDWIAIDGSSSAGTPFTDVPFFSGDVLRYGVGLSYNLVNDPCRTVAPVIEVVGWTILGGLSSSSTDGTLNTAVVEKVNGDTIVNVKAGLRINNACLGSFYVGYGRALTDESWYDDVLRVEYRWSF